MANGVLSKGLELLVKLPTGTSFTDASAPAGYYKLPNFVSIGDFGSDGIDSVEITDLDSDVHEFMGGLGAGQSQPIDFTFNYDHGATGTLPTATGAPVLSSYDVLTSFDATDEHEFQINIPSLNSATKTISFKGNASTKLSGATFNEGLKFVTSIMPKGEISL